MTIQEYIEHQLALIANKLPGLVHKDPASFACGYNAGYKTAMLELERFVKKDHE